MPQGSGNNGNTSSRVVDFNEVRTKKLSEKQRKNERIFFKQLLSVYCVVEGDHRSGIKQIDPMDVSEDGFAFQVPYNADSPWPSSDRLTIRLYFSQDTYIPVNLSIVNSNPSIVEGSRMVRYGCKVETETASYPAYQQFVRFMKTYAEQAHKDMGDVSVFYL